MRASGREPMIWNALAPKTPGPRIVKTRFPPEAKYDSAWKSRYSYTTIRNRCPGIVFEHGKNPYICSQFSSSESIPFNLIGFEDENSFCSWSSEETSSGGLLGEGREIALENNICIDTRTKTAEKQSVFIMIITFVVEVKTCSLVIMLIYICVM